jgi:glycosyltransferase involved in cell wall biosynthesis
MTYPIPEISVVMSVYNSANYLKKAIESILKQSYKNFEFIIINDGSTDESLEIINSYIDKRIIIINQQNKGLAVALNNGIRISRGKYIARMDADDFSMPERLKLQLEYLENHPEYVAIGSNAEIIDKDDNYIYTSNLPITFNGIKKVISTSPFFHSSVLMNKRAVEKAGCYFEPISPFGWEDLILWNKLINYGAFSNIEQALIKYRLVSDANTPRSRKHKVIATNIVHNIIKNGTLSDDEKEILIGLKKLTSKNDKEADFFRHIGKKYLWNNCRPKLARKYLSQSIKSKFNLVTLLYFILSFLPIKLINWLYRIFKC